MGRSAEYKPRQRGDDEERPRSLKRRLDSDPRPRGENDDLPDLRKVHDVMGMKPVEFDGLTAAEITTALETLLPEQARVKAPHLKARVDAQLDTLRNQLQARQAENDVDALPSRERPALNSLAAVRVAMPDASNRANVDNQHIADAAPTETVDNLELPGGQTATMGDRGEFIDQPRQHTGNSPKEEIDPAAKPTQTKTVERRSLKGYLKPELTSVPQVVGLEAEDLDALSPEELRTARQTLAAEVDRGATDIKEINQAMANQLKEIGRRIRSASSQSTAPEQNAGVVENLTIPETLINSTPTLAEPFVPNQENTRRQDQVAVIPADVLDESQLSSHYQNPGRFSRESIDDLKRHAIDVNSPVDALGTSPEHGRITEPTPLALARAAAARALLKRGNIFGRTGTAEMDRALNEYQAAIAADQGPKIERLKQEFGGRDLTQPDVARELQERLVAFTLTERFGEEAALREAMKESGERAVGNRFKDFWKKHSGKRALIGAGLFGATVATGGLAVPGLLAARVGMSSVGSTMMIESALQGLMDKYGDTRKLSREAISRLSQSELRMCLAAHVTRFGERGQREFGTHTTTVLKKSWSDDTGQRLLEQYQQNQRHEIERYVADHAGETPEALIAGILDNSLTEQKELHNLYVEARNKNRTNAIIKWAGAIAEGALVGTAIALTGLEHIHKIKDVKDTARAALESAHRLTSAANADSMAEAMAAGTGQHAIETGSAAAETAQTAERADSFKEIAHRGDSLWKMVANQLHRRLGDDFDRLDSARKTFMIDSINDRVAAHPQEFGLTDINHITVDQTVDFTAAFEGPQAVNLPEVVTHAKELGQSAVDSIAHNNELFGQWIAGHPGEPLNDTVIDRLIHGAASAPETAGQTAELLGASPEQLGAALTDQMTKEMVQQSVLGLAKTNPDLYAKFHELNPDCYPAVAGVTVETAAPAVDSVTGVGGVELPPSHLITLEKCAKTLDALPHTGPVRETLHNIGNMKVPAAVKAGAISAPLEKIGLDFRTARTTEQAFRKVFMDIVERTGPDTKVKDVLESIHKKLA